METFDFKIGWCRICNQGWLEIVKDKETQKLFICCTECESEWDSPEITNDVKLSTHNKYGMIEMPTYDEIKVYGWEKYTENVND